MQLSLDYGLLGSVAPEDFDCEPPANVDDDAHIDDGPRETNLSDFTQSTIANMLMSTIRLRLRVVKALNNTNPSGRDYADTLRLGAELENICRTQSSLLQQFQHSSHPGGPTDFQTRMLDLLTRRFLLALHDPFAARAKSDPSYYFSRKVVVENAILVLSDQSQSQNRPSDYTQLHIRGGGMFKHTLWHATASLCVELVHDLMEDAFSFTHRESRKALHGTICSAIELLRCRLQAGDLGVRPYVLFVCALAQVEALQGGRVLRDDILTTAQASLSFCLRVLEAQAGSGGSSSSSSNSSSTALDLHPHKSVSALEPLVSKGLKYKGR